MAWMLSAGVITNDDFWFLSFPVFLIPTGCASYCASALNLLTSIWSTVPDFGAFIAWADNASWMGEQHGLCISHRRRSGQVAPHAGTGVSLTYRQDADKKSMAISG